MIYSTPTQIEFDRMLLKHQNLMQADEYAKIEDRLGICCADLHQLDFSGRDLRWVVFDRCVLGNDMSGANFSGAIVINCSFRNAILQDCEFKNTLLEGSSFHNCDLTGSNLTSVRGSRVSFGDCDLTGAKFCHAGLRRSHFVNSNLSDVDMHHSDLKKSIIENCEVSGLCLCAADLEKIEIYKSNLLIISDSMPWANIIITANSMCIGDRCGTHEEWFSETIEEVESYQSCDYNIFAYSDWGRWAPALKLMCEQVRIGLFKPNTEVSKQHACVEPA